MKKLSMMDLIVMFSTPRQDHPGRRGGNGGRCGFGGCLSKSKTGGGKYHRRMVAAGLKPA